MLSFAGELTSSVKQPEAGLALTRFLGREFASAVSREGNF
jgi:hypothetical protein